MEDLKQVLKTHLLAEEGNGKPPPPSHFPSRATTSQKWQVVQGLVLGQITSWSWSSSSSSSSSFILGWRLLSALFSLSIYACLCCLIDDFVCCMVMIMMRWSVRGQVLGQLVISDESSLGWRNEMSGGGFPLPSSPSKCVLRACSRPSMNRHFSLSSQDSELQRYFHVTLSPSYYHNAYPSPYSLDPNFVLSRVVQQLMVRGQRATQWNSLRTTWQ